MRTILLFLVGILTTSISAQTTSIPDQGFEQALIDLGIDSDQTINGQVLTSDVASVTSLDLSPYNGGYYFVQNISGIQAFTSLKILNLSEVGLYTNLGYSPGPPLDLSALTQLEEFYFNGHGDLITLNVPEVILNNNPNLTRLEAGGNWMLERIVLKGSDQYLWNLFMIAGDYDPWTGESIDVCVQVTNSTQAENGQGIYSNWTVYGPINFSNDCSLSASRFNEIEIQLFPNPTTEYFQLKTQEEIKSLMVYSLNGKEVLKFQNQNTYDVSQIPAGIYFVKMETSKGTGIQKLIKN
ncbi:T9SS type A sorting domain-containing protein [Mesonia sp. K4-1]|uniref:T9SS type A sorting domain-containing protein n=1 Tax=Mesonia sp. K4-1 TaxID=2602760 RepID=UPI0011CB7772|nr:T9SS type A sorting domain-containing protein [Mesonia sp. K4-1]TXK73051.1 T9SS type A sorting domain-containing protein [Mesonia sp. K4-1]